MAAILEDTDGGSFNDFLIRIHEMNGNVSSQFGNVP